MGKLNAAERNALPSKDFAGPDRSLPDVDRGHAEAGKGRAKQMLKRGTISQAQYDKAVGKLDQKLGKKPAPLKPAAPALKKAMPPEDEQESGIERA